MREYEITSAFELTNYGAFTGGLMNGYFAAKYGYRWVLIVSMGFLNAFIFVVFFAPNATVLLVGQILCGLCWGVFATLSPAYASEVCPTNLRGTIFINHLRRCDFEGHCLIRLAFA